MRWVWKASSAPPSPSRAGTSTKSLVPVYHEDGSLALDREEYPRPQTTLEGLAGLKPAFAAMADYPLDDKGTTYRSLILQKYPDLEIKFMHHAGNSSGVVDGSAAVLLASPNYAKAHGLKPRARVVAMANMGDRPTLMLNAPVPAARKVLAKAGLTLDDIDLFEINEAFAVVAEKFIRDLEARPRQGQRQRRRDRARPSDRRDRLDPDRHHARRTGAARPQARPGDHVRRRRHGAGDHHRTHLKAESGGTSLVFWIYLSEITLFRITSEDSRPCTKRPPSSVAASTASRRQVWARRSR